MKAITVCQPYASMIMQPYGGHPLKTVENRVWSTPYRGPLIIHAGKSTRWFNHPNDDRLPRGVLLGVVLLIDCVQKFDMPRRYPNDFYHADGPQCWILRNPRTLPEPIPFTGARGLFNVTQEIEAQIRKLS